MRTIRWLTALAALALAACGGGSNGCAGNFAGGNCSTTTTVASVLVVSDVSRIPSDNTTQANLIAYVRDKNNNFLQGIPVIFTTTSGGVGVTQGTSDASGIAKATLNTLGDPTNRAITVTATAGGVAGSAQVVVYGTTLVIQGPNALTSGQSGAYTATLQDSSGKGIAGIAVAISGSGMSPDKTTDTTDASGVITFHATAGSTTSETIQVAAMGLTTTEAVTVQNDLVSFSSPQPPVQVQLNTNQSITAHWTSGGAAVNGQNITFATTRGCFNPAGTDCTGASPTAVVQTNASGDALVNVLAVDAGGATITATTATGASASLPVTFIAVTPAKIDVQPSVFTLGPGETSTLTATVRDAKNNLVTGVTVVFALNDVSGGSLSPASAVTDTQGRASTVYTAGSTTSAAGGVQITASIQGNNTVTPKTVALTVSRRQVFISMGTGNTILKNATSTQYEVDYIVQVTDSSGAGVPNVQLNMSVLSDFYFKGYRAFATTWQQCYTISPVGDVCLSNPVQGPATFPVSTTWGCADEDTNRNGILDPGEDNNNNGRIDAGNIALVSPATITTDTSGAALVKVQYPMEYAYWLQVSLQAQTAVQGTNYYAQSTFVLPGAADDFNTSNKSPPGPISPFGKDSTCTDTL